MRERGSEGAREGARELGSEGARKLGGKARDCASALGDCGFGSAAGSSVPVCLSLRQSFAAVGGGGLSRDSTSVPSLP